MKRVISFFFAAVLLVSLCAPASADSTAADYRASFNEYAYLYHNTYVQCYQAYNASLDDLAERIRSADITTQDQADRIIFFLTEIKGEHTNFFGTRQGGGSRMEVPYLRSSAHDAAQAKDFGTAIGYINELKTEIEKRIDFLNLLILCISSFEVLPEEEPPVTSFHDVYILSSIPTITLDDSNGAIVCTFRSVVDGVYTDLVVASSEIPSIAVGLYRGIELNADHTANLEDFGTPQATVTAISCSGGQLVTTGGTFTYSDDTQFLIIDGHTCTEGSPDDLLCISSVSPYTGNSKLLVTADSGEADCVYIIG